VSDGGLSAQETEHVLGYLRGMDHSVLDDRYELESLWRDLRLVMGPLAKVFALREGAKPGQHRRRIADALEELRPMVERYTTGPPEWLLSMEETDPGWGKR